MLLGRIRTAGWTRQHLFTCPGRTWPRPGPAWACRGGAVFLLRTACEGSFCLNSLRGRAVPRVAFGDGDECAGQRAGAALGRVAVRLALVERRPGHVHVRPSDARGYELPQEDARGEHAAPPLGLEVGDVGDRGVEPLAQLGGQRHAPGALALL